MCARMADLWRHRRPPGLGARVRGRQCGRFRGAGACPPSVRPSERYSLMRARTAALQYQLEERLLPYLQALSVFRDDVRKLARANAGTLPPAWWPQ